MTESLEMSQIVTRPILVTWNAVPSINKLSKLEKLLNYSPAFAAFTSKMSKKSKTTTLFKPGCIPWNKGLKMADCSSDIHEEAPATSNDTDGDPGSDSHGVVQPVTQPVTQPVNQVRPHGRRQILAQALKTENMGDNSGNRVVDRDLMCCVFNKTIEEHKLASPDCEVPAFRVSKEKKVGIGWKMTLRCTKCIFESPMKKFYKEIPTNTRGPNPAASNVALAASLLDTPLGNSGCRKLLAGMDIPPPAKRTMQTRTNKVCKLVYELNTHDMAKKAQTAMDENNGVLSISQDARYNSTNISSRKKPGQNASQAIAVACENITGSQYIVAAAIQNKLCWTGAWLRNKGMEITCPGHLDCTANLHRQAPLSEYELGKKIGQQLGVQGAYVKYVTTDGDGRSAAGVADIMKMLNPMWTVERHADPTHIGVSQFIKINNGKLSPGIFPSVKTKERFKECQKVLAQDIKARTSLVLNELLEKYTGNMDEMRKELPKVLRATIQCYDGDCKDCRRHSYVCDGGATNSWWQRSMFLGTHRITNLCLEENDKDLICEVIKMKLSDAAIEVLKFGTNTQKCEAVNRAISVSLPKNTKYGRNVFGRLGSTVLRLNNGVATSTKMKARRLGIRLSDRCTKAFQQMQAEDEYQKKYAKSRKTKRMRLLAASRHLREHIRYKKRNKVKSDYKKGQLDPKPSTSKGDDHSYSQPD